MENGNDSPNDTDDLTNVKTSAFEHEIYLSDEDEPKKCPEEQTQTPKERFASGKPTSGILHRRKMKSAS